jgi:hypothetical protein
MRSILGIVMVVASTAIPREGGFATKEETR